MDNKAPGFAEALAKYEVELANNVQDRVEAGIKDKKKEYETTKYENQ